MYTILVTGATGNVGFEVIKSLCDDYPDLNIIAGIRDLKNDGEKFPEYNVGFRYFDFTNVASYKLALSKCEALFLLRPPQLSDVEKYFVPLIATAKVAGIKHVVFLSVQGVESNKIIPHYKIEKLITESNIPFTFLRPAYFMQNFNTTLQKDILKKKLIFLPAGSIKFTLIDVRDIGHVAAVILGNPSKYIGKSYDLTNMETLSFTEMAEKMSKILGERITFKSPNLLNFYFTKRKEKLPSMYIGVMVMLHYLPRFKKLPMTTNHVEKISGKPAITFEQYVKDYKKWLTTIPKN